MFALFLMADFFIAMDTANISLTFSPRTYFKITEGNSQTGPPHSVVLFSKMAFLCLIIPKRMNWTLLYGIGLVNVFNKLIPGNGIIPIKNLEDFLLYRRKNNRSLG